MIDIIQRILYNKKVLKIERRTAEQLVPVGNDTTDIRKDDYMIKNRREIRRNMKAEKRIMHKKEADWERETQLREEQGQRVRCEKVNFHRPSGHDRWDPAWVPTIQVRRHLQVMKQELCDVSAERESDSAETCEVICEPMTKIVAQKRIRPGGRVERFMKRLEQERMAEDVANAAEFAKAICEMVITPKVIAAQKSGNV